MTRVCEGRLRLPFFRTRRLDVLRRLPLPRDAGCCCRNMSRQGKGTARRAVCHYRPDQTILAVPGERTISGNARSIRRTEIVDLATVWIDDGHSRGL